MEWRKPTFTIYECLLTLFFVLFVHILKVSLFTIFHNKIEDNTQERILKRK